MGAKLERYDNRTEQFRQNLLFESNQKTLFDELEGKERQTAVPDAEESRIFWNDIWGQPVRHNENAEWLRTLEEELVDIGIQENIQINLIKLKKQITRIPNWKSPGPDGVQGYWIKNLNAMHNRIKHLNHDIKAATQWYSQNDLLANKKKYQAMVIGPPKATDTRIIVKVDEEEIVPAKQLKLLGVIIDDQMNFSEHIREMITEQNSSDRIYYSSQIRKRCLMS